MSPLHEAVVLCGPPSTEIDQVHLIAKSRLQLSIDPRNFLDQTPLHFAAANHHYHINSLLDNGHDIDALDFGGFTPLMYAAISGNVSSAKRLIERGANPGIVAPTVYSNHIMDFLGIAAQLHHYEVVEAALQVMSLTRPQDDELWAPRASQVLLCLLENETDGALRLKWLRRLLPRVRDINRLVSSRSNPGRKDQSTLMHHVNSYAEAMILVDYGFTAFNAVDGWRRNTLLSHIRTDWITVSRLADYLALITLLMRDHAVVNFQHPKYGTTALHEVVEQLSGYTDTPPQKYRADNFGLLNQANLLLDHEADTQALDKNLRPDTRRRDKKWCPCAPQGLMPMPGGHLGTAHVWMFEYLSLVLEKRPQAEAVSVLQGLIRSAKYDLMGIKHERSCRRIGRGGTIDPRMSPESLEREDEEQAARIKELDQWLAGLDNQGLTFLLSTWTTLLKESLTVQEKQQEEDSMLRLEQAEERCRWHDLMVSALELQTLHVSVN